MGVVADATAWPSAPEPTEEPTRMPVVAMREILDPAFDGRYGAASHPGCGGGRVDSS